MNKKYVKYFFVNGDGVCAYIKLQSDLIFSESEAKKELRVKYPTAKIRLVSKKEISIMALNKDLNIG